jgi:hypothetical protein
MLHVGDKYAKERSVYYLNCYNGDRHVLEATWLP